MKLNTISLAISLGLVGAAAPMAASADRGEPSNATTAAPVGASDMQPALRAVRDKETGKLRAPNADEAKEMAAAERAARKARGLPETPDAAPLQVKRHASGMLSARLTPEYLVTLKGERRADGSLRQSHDDHKLDHPVAPRNALPTE